MSFLIKNTLVFDGTGSQPYRSDVFINNGKIMALENLSLKPSVDQVIDGSDLYTTPGFIDISSASDFWHPFWQHQTQFFYLEQGITTIQVGLNGFSLAPLHHSPNNLPTNWSESGLTFNWDSFTEAISVLNNRPLNINVLSGVGMLNLENIIMSSFNHRRLSASALKNIRGSLLQNLTSGASTTSFGFGFRDGHPDNSADLKQLAELSLKNSPLTTVSNHLPYDKDRRRLLTLFLQTKRRLTKSGQLIFNGLNFSDLDWFKRSHSLKEVYLSLSPAGYQLKPLASFLPEVMQNKAYSSVLNCLKDKNALTAISSHLSTLINPDFKIISAPHYKTAIGRTLKDLTISRTTDKASTLLSLFRRTELKAFILTKDKSSAFSVSDLLTNPSLMATAVADLPDTSRTFIRLIKETIKQGLPLTKTIAALTSRPARLLNLTNRGYLAENLPADLVLLNKTGDIKYVFINGSMVVQNERHLNLPTSGRFLIPTPQNHV